MLPKRLERKVIYKSDWVNLFTDKVLMPSGKIIDKYHQLEYQKETIVVLLLNKDNEICLIKSLRYTTQKIELELPAGSIEKGENILTASKREVSEETGLSAKDLKHCFSFYPSNGISNEIVHIVFGKVTDVNQSKFDTDEVKEVQWLSLDALVKLIARNEITDGISLIPILLHISGTIN